MRRAFSRNLKVFALSVALLGGQATNACTMPGQLIMARTMLNIKYPDATYVLGATWTLQQEGKLDMPNPDLIYARGAERAALDEAGRSAAVQALYDLKNALNASNEGDHLVSIVVVDRMHREQLLPKRPVALGTTSMAPGDELVIVTTEPALHAIMGGNLSFAQALSFGVMRIYGDGSRQAVFTADFGHFGSQPLPSSPVPAYLARAGSSNSSDPLTRAALKRKVSASEENTSKQQSSGHGLVTQFQAAFPEK